MLQLQLVPPHLRSIVLEVFRKKYTGRAAWSACGASINATDVKWRPSEAIRHLLTTKVSNADAPGVIWPCYVKRLFPATNITYHVQSATLRQPCGPSIAAIIMQGDANPQIEEACRMLLTDCWQEHEKDLCHIDYNYMVLFHANVLALKHTEVVAQLKPTEADLRVAKIWRQLSRDSSLDLWIVESETEKVSVVKTTVMKKSMRWLSLLLQ